ncbi:hypothetical protein [Streptomyces sp. SLBN-31]|uniref:hypothetical protein n=1 Tax=Streptomyces sp. SLBN-31 TaxID=2768444 RepID=UPI0037DA0C16
MPLPTTSTTVTPSDTVPLPTATKGTSPVPALCLLALALLSFGESRHNRHHADPASGVDGGQLDPSAAVIRLLERLGWGCTTSVGRVRPASPPAAPDINHSSMYGSWQEIS